MRQLGMWGWGFAALALTALPVVAQDDDNVSAEAAAPYLGSWALVGDFNGNALNVNLDLFEHQGDVSGLFSMALANQALPVEDISMTDEGLKLTYELKLGPTSLTIDMMMNADGDSISGNLVDRGGLMDMALTGEREEKTFPAALASDLSVEGHEDLLGWWDLSVAMQGQSIPATLALENAKGKIGAILNTAFAPAPEVVQDITVSGESLALTFGAKMGGQTMTFALQVEKSDGGVKGTFGDTNGFINAEFTGMKGEPNETLLARAHFAAVKKAADEAASGSVAQTGPRDIRASIGGETVRLKYDGVAAESEDYDRVSEMKAGDVITFVESRCIKMFTDIDLHFGDTVVEAENIAPDYPGVYGLWIKKTSDGWALVFNKFGDVWGTQYDPSEDIATVSLTHSTLSEPVAAFRMGVEETASGGQFKIAWGAHQWVAPFTVK